MLHLHQFQQAYPGRAPLLTIPALHLPFGTHWLQGFNGAGKTSFFRAVAGLIPCSGRVTLTGPAPTDSVHPLDLHHDPIHWRRAVNYGEAEPLYPPFLTARALTEFVAHAKGAPAGQLASLAETFGITAFWDQPMGTYSSGMLKKTSLVAAFLGAPRLIMLDEPLITLDTAAQRTVEALVAGRARAGVGFLLSSHQPFDPAQVPIAGQWRVADGLIQPLPGAA